MQRHRAARSGWILVVGSLIWICVSAPTAMPQQAEKKNEEKNNEKNNEKKDDEKDSSPAITPEQQAKLDEAKKRAKEYDDLCGQSQFKEALAIAEQTLATVEEAGGAKHLDTAAWHNRVGIALRETGDYAAAKKHHLRASAIYREALGENDPETARSRLDLGNAVYALGNYGQALWCYQKALATYREVRGEKHPDTAAALDALGKLHHATGDEPKAQHCYEQALAIHRQDGDEKHSASARSLLGLGTVLKSQGNFDAARKEFDEALAIEREAHGEKHPSTALALGDLGNLDLAMGNYPAARKAFEQELATCRECRGDQHADTARALNHLGNLLSETGDYAGARKKFEEALAIDRKLFGEQHAETARSLANLGGLAVTTGDLAAARGDYEQALAIRQKVLSPMHPEIGHSFVNLGNVLNTTGDYPAAKKYFADALVIYRAALGEKNASTATALDRLALASEHLGDYGAARKYYEQALTIRQAVLGEKHPDTGRTLRRLGEVYKDMGDFVAAKNNYKQALTIFRASLGEKHVGTAAIWFDLATAQGHLRDYDKARKSFEHALALYRELVGETHAGTASALAGLGNVELATGDHAGAQKHYEQALAIQKQLYADDHRDTAVALRNLGLLRYLKRDYPGALDYYQQSLEMDRRLLGDKHPDVAVALRDVARTQAAMGDWRAAVESTDEARRVVRRHEAVVLPSLSEDEQLRYLGDSDRRSLAMCLSLGLKRRDDQTAANLSAGWLLNGKAVAEEALSYRVRLSREATDPQRAKLVRQLSALRKQIAALGLRDVPKEQQPAQRSQLADLQTQAEQLARELVTLGADLGQTDTWVSVDDLRRAVPAGAVLIDIARFDLYNFHALAGASSWDAAHYVAWLIPPAGAGEVRIVDLGPADKIDAALDRANKSIQETGDSSFKIGEELAEQKVMPSLRELAALLFDPLVATVGRTKRMILSPDGPLWLAPFAALPLKDGRYAIEKYQIDYVVSGRDLLPRPARNSPSTTAPLVMADPDYDMDPRDAANQAKSILGGNKPAQPPISQPKTSKPRSATRADVGPEAIEPREGESQEIEISDDGKPASDSDDLDPGDTPDESGMKAAGLVSALHVKNAERLTATNEAARSIIPSLKSYANATPALYLEKQAAEGVFKAARRPKVVLLSTHGYYFAADPKSNENPLLRCGLLFAGFNHRDLATDADDGVLTGLEITGIDLRGTELVTLIACQTGMGEVRTGEEIAGLRQAFRLAGAKSVVATLWSIYVVPSTEIMKDIYKNLSRGQSHGAALRNAQLTAIADRRAKKKAAHPIFWAPFTITGE